MEIGRSLGMTIHRLNRLNSDFTSQAIERLSSGLRINRAADDAAGLSISESFTSQIRGTHQAIRNAQDGISMLRTAEGAFSTIHDVLQRMRELAVQAANGTYSLADRLGIQAEIEELKAQIDQTAHHTTFNGINLLVDQDKVLQVSKLPYNYISAGTATVGTWSDNTVADVRIGGPGGVADGVTWDELQAVKAQLPTLMEGALRKAQAMLYNSGLDQATLTPIPHVSFVIDPLSTSVSAGNGFGITVNLAAFFGTGAPPQVTLEQAFVQAMTPLHLGREDEKGVTSTNPVDYSAFLTAGIGYSNIRGVFVLGAAESYLAAGKPAGAFQFDAIDGDGGRSASAWFYRYLLENHGQEAVEGFARTIIESDTGSKASIVTALDTYFQDLTGMDRTTLATAVDTWIQAQPNPTPFAQNALSNTTSTEAQLLTNRLTLQIGASEGDVLDVSLLAGALGNLDFVSLVGVVDQGTAARSISTLDKAIAMVSDARGQLGATENRLQATINRLGTYAENIQQAYSRIRDTDVAESMVDLTRSQVMSQGSMASLQAFFNLQRDRVGSLLAGLE